jgi:hypothetical protein
MAKKRGGLAGVWDRNKGVIKTVAPIAAGFIPGVGPALGAALGAAMGGLDRPGKGGIGLDVGGAVKGGITGYGGAKMGQMAKGGLGKLFTAGADQAGGIGPLDKLTGAPKVGLTQGAPTSYGNTGMFDKVPLPSQAPSTGMFAGATSAPVAGGGGGGGGMMDAAKKAGSFLDRNQKPIGMAADKILNVMGQSAAGQAAEEQQKLARDKFAYEQEQDKMAQEKRRRLAQLTGQMFMPQAANIYGMGRGNDPMTMQQYIAGAAMSDGSSTPPEPVNSFGSGMNSYINSRR